jgi:hypothetical protein
MKLPNIFKRRRPGSLNLAIANTHRVSNRLVGMQLTLGNFIALALSALGMSLGFIFLCEPMIKGQPFMYGMLAVIGTSLGILIERLSLAGLIGIRGANEKIERLSDEFYTKLRKLRATTDLPGEEKELMIKEFTEQHGKAIKRLERRRNLSIPVAAVGMILSTTIGDLFWHHLFSPLQPGWLGMVLSLACACVIGLTFVYSELFKTIMDDSLEMIVKDNQLDKASVVAERESTQVRLMIDSFAGLKKDERKMRPVENQIKEALIVDMQDFADQVRDGVDVMNGARRRRAKALPAPRSGKRTLYRDNAEAFTAFMQECPNARLEDIMEEFGISRSAAGDWRLQFLNEQPIDAVVIQQDDNDDASGVAV